LTGLTVEAEDGETSLFGRKVKTMQTGITIANGAVTGTLKYISSGAIAQDWGAGNFLCLKFPDADITTMTVKVGLNPSQGSGLVALDADKNGVFKVTDKDRQTFIIIQNDGARQSVQYLDLSGLTCETE
jgi:hypothetical protein